MLGWRRMSEVTRGDVQILEQRGGRDSVLTGVVRADFERLIAPHHESDLLGLLVLKQTDVASTTLLPLRGLGREPEELRTPMAQTDRRINYEIMKRGHISRRTF